MDLRYTPEELAFRDEVRAFFKEALPENLRKKMVMGQRISGAEFRLWQRRLYDRGWASPAWAPEWGGTGWSHVQQYIFKEELHMAPAPEPISFNINMIGPVLIAFGTEEQKRHFLPRIASLEYWFCQGFSEPGSGSDLASLRTRAVREGDEYVIDGQKIWTSTAHHADWCFCLVRTDPEAKKQQGISYLLIDLKTPGITIRPIITLDGHHETNEVFFDNVRVPVANRVGEENKGWDYAKFLLGNERSGIARVGVSKNTVRRAREMAARTPVGEGTLLDDPLFAARLAEIEVDLKALEITQMRVVAAGEEHTREGKPDPKTSILKIRGSELRQRSSELLLEVAAYHGMAFDIGFVRGLREAEGLSTDEWPLTAAPNVYYNRSWTIVGGSNEIQRNILAKAVLGL